MAGRQSTVLAVVAIISLTTVNAFTSTAEGNQTESLRNGSFEDRLKLYSKWAKEAQGHGRRLSTAYAPEGAVVAQSLRSPRGAPAPAPSNNNTGNCKVLRYHTGYANVAINYNKVYGDTPNFGECCKLCQSDAKCVAWTRVAGGDAPNFRKCYLKYDIEALDQSQMLGTHEGHPGDSKKYPELRYVDSSNPTILESGTTPDLYPADYYGCPYSPGNPTTPCDPPPGCNVDGNGVFVAPPCIG